MLHGKAADFTICDVAQGNPTLNFTQDVVRIGITAGEHVQSDHAFVGISVRGAVALIEQDRAGESGRRIVPEMIPYLRKHGRSGQPGSGGHGIQNQSVVQTNVSGHIVAVDKKMASFVQRMGPPEKTFLEHESPKTLSE
ncbi:hypothetical protein V22_36710 [Calycomorphotria hydatis]|uniref:Uncharacterized protein n=1 Tax=Calycomorphotria hydatis TaxID=2528027 RepID=A0A517TDF2_9PLAN|nr:hypothetical protein V22_36710 [Calycomorphotria hydatis]